MLFGVYASEKDELEIIMAIIKCKMCGGDIELNEEKPLAPANTAVL